MSKKNQPVHCTVYSTLYVQDASGIYILQNIPDIYKELFKKKKLTHKVKF